MAHETDLCEVLSVRAERPLIGAMLQNVGQNGVTGSELHASDKLAFELFKRGLFQSKYTQQVHEQVTKLI